MQQINVFTSKFPFLLGKSTLDTSENVCLKIRSEKWEIAGVEGISLGYSNMNKKINLQMEITYASPSDFRMTKEVRKCGV